MPAVTNAGMSTHAHTTSSPLALPSGEALRHPVQQSYLLLRIGFTVAPILFGIDKFAQVMTHWTKYLASQYNDLIPGTASQAMHMVGIVEIAAGLIVLVRPRIGAYVVAAWLAGIILDLLLVGGYGDVALRDFGLLLAALTLGRLATAEERGQLPS
jgi:hypothetical protein